MLAIEAIEEQESLALIAILKPKFLAVEGLEYRREAAARMLAYSGPQGERVLCDALTHPHLDVRKAAREALHERATSLLNRRNFAALAKLDVRAVASLFDVEADRERLLDICGNIAPYNPVAMRRLFADVIGPEPWRAESAMYLLGTAMERHSVVDSPDFFAYCRLVCPNLATNDSFKARLFGNYAVKLLGEKFPAVGGVNSSMP